MTAWSVSNYRQAWYADLGPYLGSDWPPLPPLSVPSDGFQVTLTAGPPAVIPDHIYDSPYSESYLDAFGSGDNSHTTPIVGAHLYVQVLPDGGGGSWGDPAVLPLPTYTPESLVPTAYLPTPPEADPRMLDVRVYDHTGTGASTLLSGSWDVQSLDELNAPGTGSFTLHLSDTDCNATTLAYRNVCKVLFDGAERYAFRIRNRSTTLVGSGEAAAKVKTISGPGVTGDLAEMIVPYGFGARSPDVRSFTYAGPDGEWDTFDWFAPQASLHSTDARANLVSTDWPEQLNDAYWIWSSDPTDETIPQGATAYFRKDFTVAHNTSLVLFSTGDNAIELYVDEERLVALGSSESYVWQTPTRHELLLSAGTHRIAAKVVNQFDPETSSSTSPAGLLLSLHFLDEAGNAGSRILKSDTSWETTWVNQPVWSAPQIIRWLIDWNATHGVSAAQEITVGFTASQDSNGDPWEWVDGPREFQVGSSVLDVAQKLAEVGGFDFAVGPDMVLRAWQSRGSTRATVLQEAENLLEFQVDPQAPVATRVLYRTDDGWATTTLSGASRIVPAYLSLGENADESAGPIIAAALDRWGKPSAEHKMEAAVLPGSMPYTDYDVGDSLTVSGEWGDPASVRVTGLTLKQDGERVTCVPELLEV